MKRRAFGALGLTVLAVVLTGCGGRSGEGIATPNITEPAPASSAKVYLPEGNHLSKSPNSKVTIVEFTDYQSSACKDAAVRLEELTKKYAGRINVQVRNFPVVEINPKSRIAAQAAEAVRMTDSNAYPAYSKILYSTQSEWSPLDWQAATDKFAEYAKQVHIDEKTFRDAVNSQKVKSAVERDENDAKSLQLPGTPALYLNGSRVSSGLSPAALNDEIDSLLSK